MTRPDQRGLNYSDLARIVLERARTAREGVLLMGELIAAYGEATYGGNSHLIADADEGWVVIQFAGGHGLWAAERIGPDGIRVSRPGYIVQMPSDFADHTDYLGSPNLIEFAVEQGWYDPADGPSNRTRPMATGSAVRPLSPGWKASSDGSLRARKRYACAT